MQRWYYHVCVIVSRRRDLALTVMLQDAVAYSCAVFKDQEFISTYAMNNPYVEDVAESFPIWFAARFKTSNLDQETKDIIEDRIPNRLEYFD